MVYIVCRPGVTLYFKFLKWLTWVFAILTLVTMPQLLLNTFGQLGSVPLRSLSSTTQAPSDRQPPPSEG